MQLMEVALTAIAVVAINSQRAAFHNAKQSVLNKSEAHDVE